MRKTNKKTTLVVTVAAFAAVFAWEAYDSHKSACESLLAENINALSDDINSLDTPDFNDTYYVKGDKKGKCIQFTSNRNICPERGTPPDKHGSKCEIITYSAEEVGNTYEKKAVYAFQVAFYDKWKSEYGRCPSSSTEYGLHVTPETPASEHTYAE